MAGIVPQLVPPMASPQMINLTSLIDDAKCYELIRHHRWPDGVRCTACSSTAVIRHGHDEIQRNRQRYLSIYQFRHTAQSGGRGKHNRMSLMMRRSPRVNHEVLLRATFLG